MEVPPLIIRCERCSTTYELDDAVLAPDGSEVQCARCQHVFTVRPPRAPGQTLQGMPAAEPPRPAPPPAPPPPPAVSAQASAAAPPPRRPAVYKPPVSQPSIPRAPVLRRDTVGTFESRLRWSHRWKWLAPVMLIAVVGAAVGAFALRAEVADAGARSARARALALALADDVQSLEQAHAQLDLAVQAAPRLHAARADRALVDLLLAGALAEAPGDGADAKAKRERARTLANAAGEVLEELRRANLARAEVARARAVAAGAGTSRAELRRLSTAALGELPGDPWVLTTEAAADVRSNDHAARERALSELSALVARRPDALRPRYVLARGQALAGRRNEALATLEALLKANPRHEGALALRDSITRPPTGTPIAQPLTANAGQVEAPPAPPARPEKPAGAPRKPDSTAGEPGGTSPPPRPPRPPAPRAPAPTAEEPVQAAPPPAEPPPATIVPAAEPPPPPRLRPAAVPEPEPVRGGD